VLNYTTINIPREITVKFLRNTSNTPVVLLVQGSVTIAGTIDDMCRSIKRLREGDVPATETEIREAALQFVRKVSGYRAPSKRNEEAFNGAVDEVAEASRRLLEAVTHPA
jgi:hypothetical protein